MNPWEPAQTLHQRNIYELSQNQFDLLSIAANGGSLVFASVEPTEDDPPYKKKKLTEEMQQIKDLITLGFLTNVSHKFKETIQVAKINHNRGILITSVTPLGVACFRDIKNRTVN